tara:strand:- start:87 stop:701 length:615 start_codon:yes stop_codon:yes gene_type:complete
MHFNQILSKIGLIFLIFVMVSQCGIYKKTDARKVPTNAKERVKKNIAEGKKIKFGQLGKGGSGTFEFATSNEMWRATVDILDFMPLANVDYGGGVIITDWYNEGNQNDSIKIMVQFLSNEIRADGLKVIVYDRKCGSTNSLNCSTSVDDKNSIGQELKLAILKKAAEMKIQANQKKADEYNKKTKGIITGAEAGSGEGANDNKD